MMATLISMYHDGAITANHLIGECLSLIDPAEPALVLDAIPDDLFDNVVKLVEAYRPGRMVTNLGLLPSNDQIEAARSWLEGRKSCVVEDIHKNA